MQHGIERFDVAISNPPYQLDVQSTTASRRTTVEIFPHFHQAASTFAELVAMIYPATWQKNIVQGFGRFLVQDSIVAVENYDSTDLFPQVRKNFSMSIVQTARHAPATYTVHGAPRSRDTPVFLDDERKRILYERTRQYPKLHGVSSPNTLVNIAQSGLPFYKSPKTLHNPVSVYIKRAPGTQADGGTWWIERSALEPMMTDAEALDRYDVAIQSSVIGRMRVMNEQMFTNGNIGAQIYGKNETHAITWSILDSFATREEAENYLSYVHSRVYSLLVMLDYVRASFASYVPDLGDYTNANPVFTPDALLSDNHVYHGKTLDGRLYHFFGLTAAEIRLVEERHHGKL